MQEFSTVTASSYDPDALAPLLNEQAADGWSVVSIVSAGTNIVAYLQREADGSGAEAAAPADEAAPAAEAPAEAPAEEQAAGDSDSPFVPAAGVAAGAGAAAVASETPAAEQAPVEASPVEEPAGWAQAPDDTTDATTETTPVAEATAAEPEVAEPAVAETPAAEPAAETPAEPAVTEPAAAADPAVPAGWYADPSGRFELRYWEGASWTEHVSRGGQQFTDPPVA